MHWKKKRKNHPKGLVHSLHDGIRQKHLSKFNPFDNDPNHELLTAAMAEDLKEWVMCTTGNLRRDLKAANMLEDGASNTDSDDEVFTLFVGVLVRTCQPSLFL